MTIDRRLRVAVLGGTGMVGQRFIESLNAHPWFELTCLSASERSQGKPYGEACSWQLDSVLPESVASMPVRDLSPRSDIDLAFSALAASVAGDVEEAWAKSGIPVFSNARNHRMAQDVPLLVPEVNAEHLKLVERQKSERGYPGSGFIATNPNCSTTFLVMALAPLERTFGLKRVSVVTLQAVSGAGYPGLPSMDILGNVIPFISGEEAKMEEETKKILGQWVDGVVEPAGFTVSAQVNRVPVIDGHTEAVSFELSREASIEEIREALTSFRGEPQRQNLPSAPERPIVFVDGSDTATTAVGPL